MSPLRVLRGFIFGGLGGFLAWIFSEFLPFGYPFQASRFEAMRDPRTLLVSADQMALLGLAIGIAIGGLLGVSEGISEGTTSRFRRAVLWFLALGAVGGFLGLFFGQSLYGFLGGRTARPETAAAFFQQILARSAGWTLMGLFLGIVFGVPTLSVRRMFNGAIGGVVGGFLGGFFFETLTLATAGILSGIHVRLIGFVLIGAFIGFFINLIAEAMKRVWVKVLIGRNEGREFVLDTPLAYVGRDELAEIPVFLDPMVPKRMASFRSNGGRYSLFAESAGLPITVNGQPMTQGQVLRDGDAIQFGRITLGYYEKATASGSGAARPIDRIPLADYGMPSTLPGAVPIPSGPGVCEFCGERRDPATGMCACSVADGGVPAPAPAYGGYDPAAYPAQPAYGGAQPAYGGQPDYGAGAYAGVPDAYGAPAPDGGYGATMLDPAGGYAAPAGVGPQLSVTAGPYAGQAFPLQAQELGIGRDPSQDIPLPADGTASRRHARIYHVNGSWVLRDEGSSNGTWINGVRIQEQQLFPGDSVRVGQTYFQFDM